MPKLAKHVWLDKNFHVILLMPFILFIARNTISSLLNTPLLNSKLDLGITNQLLKQTRKPVRSPHTLIEHVPHILSDFSFQCIDQIQTNPSQDTEKLLITKKAYWSVQLISLSPFGLNKRQELHSKNQMLGFQVSWSRFLAFYRHL